MNQKVCYKPIKKLKLNGTFQKDKKEIQCQKKNRRFIFLTFLSSLINMINYLTEIVGNLVLLGRATK